MSIHRSFLQLRSNVFSLIRLLALCFLLVVLLSRLSSKETGPAGAFDLIIEAELGEDRGQGLGTLFEVRNVNGRLLFGAGFQDSFSTYIRDNNRLLSFFCTSQNTQILIEPLGKPLGPESTDARLIVDNGVFAFPCRNYGYSVRISDMQHVGSDLRSNPNRPFHFFGFQYIGDKRLLNLDEELGFILSLDGKVILSSAEFFRT